MNLEGFLSGLTHHVADPVSYQLQLGGEKLNLTDCMNRQISISFTGEKACISCGRKVKKLYQNGYCFPCVTTLAECDLCIVKPELCHFHLGTCRDEAYGLTHCMVPHYVYLAYSSGFKVGITRKGRELTRWIDQGATEAVLLAEVPIRKTAGEMEVEIAKNMADKTDWRKMLKNNGTPPETSILMIREQAIQRLADPFRDYVISGEPPVFHFVYPREAGFEVKTTSLSLDKEPLVEGELRGIKGQYLLFDRGVLNMKKHAGYRMQVQL